MDDVFSSNRGEHESLIVCTVVVQSSGEECSMPCSVLPLIPEITHHPNKPVSAYHKLLFSHTSSFSLKFDCQLYFSYPRLFSSLQC